MSKDGCSAYGASNVVEFFLLVFKLIGLVDGSLTTRQDYKPFEADVKTARKIAELVAAEESKKREQAALLIEQLRGVPALEHYMIVRMFLSSVAS